MGDEKHGNKMNKFIIFSIVAVSVLLQSCSIGQDKKRFECTEWTVRIKNYDVADIIADIENSALGSEATFEFFDNQIKMTFQGDQIVFTKNKDGHYIYEQPYSINNRNVIVEYQLCPREIGGGFISSIDIYFWVDHDQCGEASFSRSW